MRKHRRERRQTLDEFCFCYRGALLILAAGPIIGAPLLAAPGGATVVAGAAVALGGALLRILAIRSIGKRARVHKAGAQSLLTGGLYAHVRNPLYIANSVVLLGLGIAAGLGWASAIPPVVALAIYTRVVRHEERALSKLFGPSYDAYRAAVPRWIPRLRPGKVEGDAAPEPTEVVPWREVFSREGGFLAGVVGAIAGILAIRFADRFLEGPLRTLDQFPWSDEVLVVVAIVIALAAADAWRASWKLASQARRRARRAEKRAAASAAPPAEDLVPSSGNLTSPA